MNAVVSLIKKFQPKTLCQFYVTATIIIGIDNIRDIYTHVYMSLITCNNFYVHDVCGNKH